MNSSSSPSAADASNHVAPLAWRQRAIRLAVRTGCMLALLWAAFLFADYPLGPAWPAWIAAMYLGASMRWPRLPIFLLPLLLPVLNLAPWSGRFFFDEFDLLLLLTVVSSHLAARPTALEKYGISRPVGVLSALFLLSSVAGMLHGAWPLADADLSTWNSYLSNANGLRTGKALLWAWLLLPLLRQNLASAHVATLRTFSAGMLVGLLATVIVIARERAAFPGVFDFDSAYRACGPFFEMHVGGAAIEAYLVMALPFAANWSLESRGWGQRLTGIAIFIGGTYSLLVTYARGGYGAGIVALAVLFAMLAWRGRLRFGSANSKIVLTLLASVCVVALPVLRGGYMSNRLHQAQQDLDARAAHWRHAIAMMNAVPGSDWFGLGSGRFPARYLAAASPAQRPAQFSFVGVADKPVLELQAGLPLRFEQIVPVQHRQNYRVALRARLKSADGNVRRDGMLSVRLCERWLLYDGHCERFDLALIGATQGWQNYTGSLSSFDLVQRRGWLSRPVKFSLVNTGSGTIQIDSVSLSNGPQELIANGSFAHLMDHWYFSTDTFDAWHFENTWLQIFFEQGSIGLLLFSLLVISASVTCALRCKQGDDSAPLWGAVLAGFLTLGTLDSLFDFPRLGLLFFVVLAFIFLQPYRPSDPA